MRKTNATQRRITGATTIHTARKKICTESISGYIVWTWPVLWPHWPLYSHSSQACNVLANDHLPNGVRKTRLTTSCLCARARSLSTPATPVTYSNCIIPLLRTHTHSACTPRCSMSHHIKKRLARVWLRCISYATKAQKSVCSVDQHRMLTHIRSTTTTTATRANRSTRRRRTKKNRP